MLILLDIDAIVIVGNRPMIIGRKVHIQIFGFPMNTKGMMTVTIICDESWREDSNIFDDLMTGVFLCFMIKNIIIEMQLSDA